MKERGVNVDIALSIVGLLDMKNLRLLLVKILEDMIVMLVGGWRDSRVYAIYPKRSENFP